MMHGYDVTYWFWLEQPPNPVLDIRLTGRRVDVSAHQDGRFGHVHVDREVWSGNEKIGTWSCWNGWIIIRVAGTETSLKNAWDDKLDKPVAPCSTGDAFVLTNNNANGTWTRGM